MSLFVGCFVESEGLLSVRLVRNDGLRAAIAQPFAQSGAIIGFVSKHLPRWFGAPDQWLCRWTVMRLTAAQQDGKKAAFSICDCVDFRIAPAARASNRLVLLPLFLPMPSGAL